MKIFHIKSGIIIASVISIISITGCSEEAPVGADGKAYAEILALGDTSLTGSPAYAPMKNAKAIITSEYGASESSTDENGILHLDGVPSGAYNISVRASHPLNPNIMIAGNLSDVKLNSLQSYTDTVYAGQTAGTGIAINEIYAGGPVNNIFFFYDQFIELYNYSAEVKYLDGMQVIRMSGNNDGKGPGADENGDGDIDAVTYIFKFPGAPGEKNYPFYPEEYLVLASTAIDHRKSVSTSIDLSSADWEFYNQYSVSDFDNKNVPNLENIKPESTIDFLINLTSDVIILASGEDEEWRNGVDINTIIDGVQYVSSSSSNHKLDKRVDKSYILSPAKYSGSSMRRREDGIDTNNGLLDWEQISTPTPGYH